MTSYFGGPLPAVHLLYNPEITLEYRIKHLQHFSPNGYFVHLLEVLQKIDQSYAPSEDDQIIVSY